MSELPKVGRDGKWAHDLRQRTSDCCSEGAISAKRVKSWYELPTGLSSSWKKKNNKKTNQPKPKYW